MISGAAPDNTTRPDYDELLDALRKIATLRLDTRERDELRGCHKARIEMQQIARAVVAREESARKENT